MIVRLVVRRLLLVLVLIVVTLPFGSPAEATSCDPPDSEQEAFRLSAVVVDGQALRWDHDTQQLTIKVLEVHKGTVAGQNIQIFTNGPDVDPGGLDMAWRYQIGQSYRVHAHHTAVGLATGGCSANVALQTVPSAAPPVVVEPERGQAPMPGDDGPGDGGRLAVALLLLSAGTGLAIRRSVRRSVRGGLA